MIVKTDEIELLFSENLVQIVDTRRWAQGSSLDDQSWPILTIENRKT
jgi:hypothetical protein